MDYYVQRWFANGESYIYRTMKAYFYELKEVRGIDEIVVLTLEILLRSVACNELFRAIEWSLGDGRSIFLRRVSKDGKYFLIIRGKKYGCA